MARAGSPMNKWNTARLLCAPGPLGLRCTAASQAFLAASKSFTCCACKAIGMFTRESVGSTALTARARSLASVSFLIMAGSACS